MDNNQVMRDAIEILKKDLAHIISSMVRAENYDLKVVLANEIADRCKAIAGLEEQINAWSES